MLRSPDNLHAQPADDEAASTSEHLRQLSLKRYRLNGLDGGTLNTELQPLAMLAQRALDADFAAVHILDGARQVCVAATAGVPLTTARRSTSVSHHLLSQHRTSKAFITEDARIDPFLVDGRWMGGDDADVRFYAAAPLIGREGVPLGVLCVWSTSPSLATNVRRVMLEELGQRVVAVLDERRDLVQPAPATQRISVLDTPKPPPSDGVPAAGGRQTEWSIGAIIAERAIYTVFQPIVHLESGTVVGFEALTRGPQGSALESPMALLRAAEAEGRLGELDWLCRVTAMEAAAASGLHPSLSWFINIEPIALSTPCPEHLLPALARASTDLRVVLEIVERGIQSNATRLLHVIDQARRNTWGIALDDVGADEDSLAMLPLIQPDVVKLDMSLMDTLNPHRAAGVVAAVSAYAEHRGAVVLAEGIESEEQRRLARLFGAQYGQGYLFGHPGPLPDSVVTPRHVVPLRQPVESLDSATPFQLLSTHIKPRTAAQAEIAHIGAYMQQQALDFNEPGVVLANFQHTRFLTDAAHARLRQIAESNALTVVVAQDLQDSVDGAYRIQSIPPDSPMTSEWIVIVLRPHYAAAFAARDSDNHLPDDNRPFDYIVTHNRDLIITAARTFLRAMETQLDIPWLSRDSDLGGKAAADPSTTVADGNDTRTPAHSIKRSWSSRLVHRRNAPSRGASLAEEPNAES